MAGMKITAYKRCTAYSPNSTITPENNTHTGVGETACASASFPSPVSKNNLKSLVGTVSLASSLTTACLLSGRSMLAVCVGL